MKKISLGAILLTLVFAGCNTKVGVNTQNSVPAAATPASASAPVQVTSAALDGAEPAIAVDVEGKIYVVYVIHDKEKSADVFLQRYDDTMKTDGEPVRINPEPGQVAAWRGDQPTIAAMPGGMIYIGWNSRVESANGPAENLFLSVSRDGGRSFDAPVKVNDDTAPRGHGLHALAVEDDNVYFAWLDERYLNTEPVKPAAHKPAANAGGPPAHHPEPNREMYFAVSNDGGKSFLPNKKLAGNVCPCCKAGLAVADGNVYASWRQVLPGDFRHIAVASSADRGATFKQPVIVSDDKWQLGACPVSGAALAVAADGTLLTVWYTAGQAGTPGLYLAESKDRGQTFSPRKPVAEGTIMGTSVLTGDELNSHSVIWSADGKISARNIERHELSPQRRELFDGELPAAATGKNFIFTAFVRNSGGLRSVWLAKTAV